jgi:glycosyltransferase involved in cell wall biosynthesis
LTVVIPVYNEAGIIRNVIEEALEVLRRHGGSYELIAVNDGSSDGTLEILNKMMAEIVELRVAHHERNQGMGAALRTGCDQARHDVVTWIPGDGQFDLAEVLKGLEGMNGADMMIALRTGYRIGQFTVPLRPRLGGVSKVANLRTYLSNVLEMTRIWWRTRG